MSPTQQKASHSSCFALSICASDRAANVWPFCQASFNFSPDNSGNSSCCGGDVTGFEPFGWPGCPLQ